MSGTPIVDKHGKEIEDNCPCSCWAWTGRSDMREARWKITRGNTKIATYYGSDAEAMTQLCHAIAYGEKCVVEPDNDAARVPSSCRRTRREWDAHAQYVRSRKSCCHK